jgi:hypothetical protein
MRRFHAVLVDIDHSPRSLLHGSHRPFYTTDGLRRAASHLYPGGVFALWSADPPDEGFRQLLGAVFTKAKARPVAYYHPLLDCEETNTIYVAAM